MRHLLGFAILVCALTAVVAMGLVLGLVQITLEKVWVVLTGQPTRPITQLTVGSVRLPRIIATCLAGVALRVTGLTMQTLFRNPLADPFILGTSAGSSLGVAAVILMIGGGRAVALTTGLGSGGDLVVVVASVISSRTVIAMVLFVGHAIRSSVTLLLIEAIIGYLVSAGASVMMPFSAPQLTAAYSRWGFGSYGGVTWVNSPLISAVIGAGLVASLVLLRPLDVLLLGERYMQSVGLNLGMACMALIALASVLAGTVTASRDPIQLFGTAVPHLARGMFNTSDHRVLIPTIALMGVLLALTVDIIAGLLGDLVLPLNAINAAFGTPMVIWILLQCQRAAL